MTLSDHLCWAIGMVSGLAATRDDELLLTLLVDKLPLANVLLVPVRHPDLVFEFPPLLALRMLESACWVQARVELAHGSNVAELAVGGSTIGAVPARWHRWVPEGAF